MAPLADVALFIAIALLLGALFRALRRVVPERRAIAVGTGALVATAAWSLTLLYPQIYLWTAVILSVGLGVQAFRSFSVARPGVDRFVSRTLVPLGGAISIACALLVLGGRWRESRAIAALPEAREGAPNVLLLILDTVRAQSLGMYGSQRNTSPRLDSLGRMGVVFDRAIAGAPWTIPSHATVFTGRNAHELTADWLTPLDDTTPTLAEAMQRRGYATAGFVANYMVSWEVGLGRGFAHYADYRLSLAQLVLSSSLLRKVAYVRVLRRLLDKYDTVNRKPAPMINGELLDWLDRRRGRPFFAFLNYFDAHEGYHPPEPYRSMFGSDSARKNWKIEYLAGGVAERSDKRRMQPHEVQAELDAYEASIAYLDHHIGALMDSLAARGLLNNTVVIVTADHGEQFGEHGLFDHANSLYPQLLHVPLLVYAPRLVPVGRRVPQFVTLRDVAATMLAMGPASSELPGRSLTRFWDRETPTANRAEHPYISSLTNPFWSPNRKASVRQGLRGVVMDGLEVIEEVGGTNRTELFDLRRDPLANSDLAADSASRPTLEAGRAILAPLTWRSQAPGIAQKAGNIGVPKQ